MSERIYGAKYDKALGLAEIAKRARFDIKVAIADGSLPSGTYSVTIQRYSMGRSITIRWSWHDLQPMTIFLLNHERVRWEAAHPHDWAPAELGDRFSATAVACREKLEAILSAYNYDRPGERDQNFHQHVTTESTWSEGRHEIERGYVLGGAAAEVPAIVDPPRPLTDDELEAILLGEAKAGGMEVRDARARPLGHVQNVVHVDFRHRRVPSMLHPAGLSPDDAMTLSTRMAMGQLESALDAVLATPPDAEVALPELLTALEATIDAYADPMPSPQEQWLQALGIDC